MVAMQSTAATAGQPGLSWKALFEPVVFPLHSGHWECFAVIGATLSISSPIVIDICSEQWDSGEFLLYGGKLSGAFMGLEKGEQSSLHRVPI